MKLFDFGRRKDSSTVVPQVRVSTLHLTGPGQLRGSGDHLNFFANDTREVRIDIEGLTEIVAYGELHISPKAMELLHKARIAVAWLSGCGTQMIGRLTQDSPSQLLTHLLQYHAWEDATWEFLQAREIVLAKLESARGAIRHYQRQGKRLEDISLNTLDSLIDSAREAKTVEQLRGWEGKGAADWYAQFAKVLCRDWKFPGRNRRPPKDPVNALLSFGYTYLYRRVAARIESKGFEGSLGALHSFRPGRMSMACDIMEPLRIPVVDRWVIALCNQGFVSQGDFEVSAENGCRLKADKLRNVVVRLEQHWHQGMFQQVLDELLKRWDAGLRTHASHQNSRAASYLKSRFLRASGESEDDDL